MQSVPTSLKLDLQPVQMFAAEQLEHLSGQANNEHSGWESPAVIKIFGELQVQDPNNVA